MHSNCPLKYLTSIKYKFPNFYYELLYTWFSVKQATNLNKEQLSYKCVLREVIWLNKDITYKGSVLLYKNWIKSNVLFIGDIVSKNGFLSNSEIKAKLIHKDGRWLSEYAKVRAAINSQWIKCIRGYKQKNERGCNTYERIPF